MKQITLAFKHFSVVLIALFGSLVTISCGNDDEPAPQLAQTYNGSLTTTLPSMPTFEAVVTDGSVQLTWDGVDRTSATAVVSTFNLTVQTPMGERAYEIGEMTVPVTAHTAGDGTIMLRADNFTCQAGNFAVTGSAVGKLAGGELSLTLTYKPGAMPMEVQTLFVGR